MYWRWIANAPYASQYLCIYLSLSILSIPLFLYLYLCVSLYLSSIFIFIYSLSQSLSLCHLRHLLFYVYVNLPTGHVLLFISILNNYIHTFIQTFMTFIFRIVVWPFKNKLAFKSITILLWLAVSGHKLKFNLIGRGGNF